MDLNWYILYTGTKKTHIRFWNRRDVHTEITCMAITVWKMNLEKHTQTFWPDSYRSWEASPQKTLHYHRCNIVSWKNSKIKNNPLCLSFQPVKLLTVKGNKSLKCTWDVCLTCYFIVSSALYLAEQVNMLAQNVTHEALGAKRDKVFAAVLTGIELHKLLF